MNFGKKRHRAKWLIGMLMIFCVTFGLGRMVAAEEFGLGDIPLDPQTYQQYLRIWPDQAVEALPTSYDARNDGIVTSPKNQGSCGSCWAFASVGAFESHLLKEFSFGPTDLSEQQQVSCNLARSGCCGGNMSALRWWEDRGPIYESCFPYGESGTVCPTQRTVPCSGASGCKQTFYRVTNWHTVGATPNQFKASLYNDGPSYWRYDVYSDFYNFWNTGSPGDVYVNEPGYAYRGGHAVLIIGWDDGKEAYLCKNSWGATGGPNDDGTFWIAYSGHYNDLGFAMANFDLIAGAIPDIKANGSDGPVTITQLDNLSVTVALDPGIYSGVQADWWVLADTPVAWYRYDVWGDRWVPGMTVTYQGPLGDLGSYEVLNMSGLPLGDYTFYFGVDGNVNGVIDDPLYYDSVEVNITP